MAVVSGKPAKVAAVAQREWRDQASDSAERRPPWTFRSAGYPEAVTGKQALWGRSTRCDRPRASWAGSAFDMKLFTLSPAPVSQPARVQSNLVQPQRAGLVSSPWRVVSSRPRLPGCSLLSKELPKEPVRAATRILGPDCGLMQRS